MTLEGYNMTIEKLLANRPTLKFKNGQAWLFVLDGAYVRIFPDVWYALIFCLAHYKVAPKIAGD